MAPSFTRAEAKPVSSALKPKALVKGSRVGVFAPASPAEETRIQRGLDELRSLGFALQDNFTRASQAYFSSSTASRLADFQKLLSDPKIGRASCRERV